MRNKRVICFRMEKSRTVTVFVLCVVVF
jgi:hypothetical protein